ncbi:RICIN domain-containing protein [Streptomyces sp. NPDC048581]|uniref:RICIN domain-containing protein n=1 Tax=Streptomyces sp. NPDC048581 TaxID=3365572 RepID=UPI003715BAE1
MDLHGRLILGTREAATAYFYNQRWKLVDAGSGYVRLVNVRNGWCEDVEGGSAADGARVIQWPVGDGTNQQWRLVAL